jgi:hypothetical protein
MFYGGISCFCSGIFCFLEVSCIFHKFQHVFMWGKAFSWRHCKKWISAIEEQLNVHFTMKKYKVLQMGLQLGFPVVTDICNHNIYIALSLIKQVAAIATDTLCHIQYHIYGVTHMQLYATSFQLISTSNSHTHSNVVNEMPMWHFIDN